jgi:hypothetical protein
MGRDVFGGPRSSRSHSRCDPGVSKIIALLTAYA